MNNFEQRIRTDEVPAKVRDLTFSIISCSEDLNGRAELYQHIFDLISILTPLPQTYQAAPAFELLRQEIESIKK
jgi:hypothetical protein